MLQGLNAKRKLQDSTHFQMFDGAKYGWSEYCRQGPPA